MKKNMKKMRGGDFKENFQTALTNLAEANDKIKQNINNNRTNNETITNGINSIKSRINKISEFISNIKNQLNGKKELLDKNNQLTQELEELKKTTQQQKPVKNYAEFLNNKYANKIMIGNSPI